VFVDAPPNANDGRRCREAVSSSRVGIVGHGRDDSVTGREVEAASP